jgi:hypothetical protein
VIDTGQESYGADNNKREVSTMTHNLRRMLVLTAATAVIFGAIGITAAQEEGTSEPTVKSHIVARAAMGKAQEAAQFAREITAYVNENYPEASSIEVFSEVFGDAGTIHWFVDYPDLATLESVLVRLQSDQRYQALLVEAADLFIEGSAHETLMIRIP